MTASTTPTTPTAPTARMYQRRHARSPQALAKPYTFLDTGVRVDVEPLLAELADVDLPYLESLWKWHRGTRFTILRAGPQGALPGDELITGHGVDAPILERLPRLRALLDGALGFTAPLAWLGLSPPNSAIRMHVDNTAHWDEHHRVHLPLVAQEGPGQAHVSAVPHAEERLRGGEHVLVVEDEATVRMVTAHMLETLGYRVTTATDGVDAQAVLAAHPDVAVVITDLSMPRMNGRALALALEHSHPNLPVVFMSAHLDVPDLRSRVEQGRVAFIQKPATREQLGTQVRATLREAGRDTVATGQEQSRQ